MKHFLWIVLLAISLAADGIALRCYVCNSHTAGSITTTNPKCHDPFSEDGAAMVECATSCQTTRATATHPVHGVQYFTERQCAATIGTVGCTTQMVADVPYLRICHCDSDLCNAAPADVVPEVSTTAVVAATTPPAPEIIQCYECNFPTDVIFEGTIDRRCNDPSSEVGIATVDCAGSCGMYILTFSATVGIPHLAGQTVTSRRCESTLGLENGCHHFVDSIGVGLTQSICYCSNHLCNDSPVGPTAPAVTVPVVTLSCYQCQHTEGEPESASNQRNCADPFNSTSIAVVTDIGGRPCVLCAAAQVTIGSKTATIRGCLATEPSAGESGGVIGCNTNNCNGGPATVVTVSPALTTSSPTAAVPGLSCYQCIYSDGEPDSAENQKNCADPFDGQGILTVTSAAPGYPCVSCAAVKYILNGNVTTARNCLPVELPLGQEQGIVVCKTDYCNSRPATLITLPTDVTVPTTAQSVVTAPIAEGLSCYQCTYTAGQPASAYNQRNCLDPFNPEGITMVTSSAPGYPCIACATVQATIDGNATIVRICLVSELPDGQEGGIVVCRTDNCNGGPATIVTLPPLTVTDPTILPTATMPAATLHCYNCTYSEGQVESAVNQRNCADPFNSEGIATITSFSADFPCTACVSFTFELNGNVSTYRSCVGAEVPIGEGGLYCHTDHCNGGPAAAFTLPPAATTVGDPSTQSVTTGDTVTEIVTATQVVTIAEEVTDAVTDAITEAVTEAVTDAVTEAVTDAVTEAVTDAVTDFVTEAVTDAVTDAVTEAVTVSRVTGVPIAVTQSSGSAKMAGTVALVLFTLFTST
ncbi:hypothetical protein BV898_16585 [Hypsibius exemplaris]|uniref:UPAR/Ly6 domain-containing protein n=1 Tax=Hypsibius exemplaris TaxID=2072580 RepID=A0A9X6NF42_HYPEX|nr:hypothetical protein BV898_16585 [Hypsibius exemplaris]